MNGIEFTAIGNLTRDAELRFSSNGKAWATFSVAVNEISTVNGERRENVSYLDCKVFGEQAEYLVESAGKGNRVFVTGKLRDEKWTDQSGAERRTKTLYVDEIGVSIRWATASVTKKATGSSQAAPAPVASNGGDFSSDVASTEENPFI
jgi:single-strand DNA-binding protein